MTASIEEEIYDEEVNRMYNEFVQRMKMQGISEDLYFEYTKTSKDDLRKKMKEEAVLRVRVRYLLEKIKEVENISVSSEDVNKEIKRIADMYQMKEDEIVKAFGSEDAIKFDLEMKKTLDFLVENN